ncbi:ArsC/Spx/MgsR family protein [Gluconobacter cerinus]|uniref:ArsC/Spx/MgsR family protein n=1 Tax=Gluconobacter cerinus TaxID=38307 RepID=UPI001B8D9044|nr:ArsC/Spx/MgsR family protein [Gluconobacter cerinus]MBS1070090.1 arsenate reductase [Gluconobacter cerinus]
MSNSIILYGIKACDSMKRAQAWLTDHGIDYAFHDYKKSAISRGILDGWVGQVGWEILLNKAGTTFRKLPPEQKEDMTQEKAITLMLGYVDKRSDPEPCGGDIEETHEG